VWTLLAALGSLTILLVITAREHVRGGEIWWLVLGGALFAYALARSVAGAFGTLPPCDAPDHGTTAQVKTRWRVAWAVGGLTLCAVAFTHIAFTVDDDTMHPHSAECPAAAATASGAQPASLRSAAADTSRADRPTPAPANPTPAPATNIDFGFERGVQTTTFVMSTVKPADAVTVEAGDFEAIVEDGHAASAVAKVSEVHALTDSQVLVRLQVDLSCRSRLTGGSMTVATVYHGPLAVDATRWDATVRFQSRILAYALALIPLLVVLAMYQAFDVWPICIKRWFTSVIAIGVPVLAAYRVTGLDNATWDPKMVTLAGLIGATYAAGLAAANLVKHGGHDLADASDPAAIRNPQAIS
jgi:hypothetical protein